MVANKLPATVLAQVFLLVIAGFAVSLYILPTATGTANGILSFHTSNIPCLRCFLFARRLSAYILGHHLKLKTCPCCKGISIKNADGCRRFFCNNCYRGICKHENGNHGAGYPYGDTRKALYGLAKPGKAARIACVSRYASYSHPPKASYGVASPDRAP